MADQLRAIALTVDEPSPGLFYWALLERQAPGSPSSAPPAAALPDIVVFDMQVAKADEPYNSFEKAARAGLLNWSRLAGGDVSRGPRTTYQPEPLEPLDAAS